MFLNAQNVQGILGLLPEMALVAIGVTLLMICGEFDLSVGSVFALCPMVMGVLLADGVSPPPPPPHPPPPTSGGGGLSGGPRGGAAGRG